jgi:SAM-dependent methyltransferase
MAFYKNEEQQVSFLKNLVDINQDTRILDLGYGQGNHLTKLQELSNYVFGYDKEINEVKSPQLPNTKKIDIFKDDWEHKNLDLIYCFAPEFGRDWDNFESLVAKISTSLKSKGKFVLDLFDWNSILVGVSFQEWKLFKPKKTVMVSRYTREEKAMVCKRKVILPEFEIKEFETNWRVFDREELMKIMNQAGFKVAHECYSFDLNKVGSWQPQLKRQRLVIVFEKE